MILVGYLFVFRCICMNIHLLVSLMYGFTIVCIYIYIYTHRIASNYGPGVYFFPAIFNQATKRGGRLLSEETRAVYNL